MTGLARYSGTDEVLLTTEMLAEMERSWTVQRQLMMMQLEWLRRDIAMLDRMRAAGCILAQRA